MWEEIFHFRTQLKPRAEILQKRERESREARDAQNAATSAAQIAGASGGVPMDTGSTDSVTGDGEKGTTPTPASTPVSIVQSSS